MSWKTENVSVLPEPLLCDKVLTGKYFESAKNKCPLYLQERGSEVDFSVLTVYERYMSVYVNLKTMFVFALFISVKVSILK